LAAAAQILNSSLEKGLNFSRRRARAAEAMNNGNATPKAMGPVRVKVKLTHVADQAAVATGRKASAELPRVEADALVDTDTVRSCVPAPLLERLGIEPYERTVVEHADGRKEAVAISEGVRFEIMNRRSWDDALVLGDEVLIGQTSLEWALGG